MPTGKTLLHHAASAGHLAVVDYLITVERCNPSSLDKNKLTPLHLASRQGHLSVVGFLLTCAVINTNILTSPSSSGFTPLHYAIDAGHLQVAKLLSKGMQEARCDRRVIMMIFLECLLLAVEQANPNAIKVLTECASQRDVRFGLDFSCSHSPGIGACLC